MKNIHTNSTEVSGAFHSIKSSCLNFLNFCMSNGRVFPPGQTNLVLFQEHISCQELLDKMLKDRDEVAVLNAISCFMWRNLIHVHIQNYFKQIFP